jgi:hypothetical protein
MAKTFDTSRVGGGTYELAQDANGNYNLNSVGFNQVNKLNLPDLKDSKTSVADTTKKATEDTIKAQTTEVFTPSNVYQSGDGEGNNTKSMVKEAKVKEATVRSAGDSSTYNSMTDAEKNAIATGTATVSRQKGPQVFNEPMTFRGVETSKQVGPQVIDTTKTYSTPRTIKDQKEFLGTAIPEKTTGLQKVTSKAGQVIDNVKNSKAIGFATTALGLVTKSPIGAAVKGLTTVASALGGKLRGIDEKTGKVNTQAQYEANRDAASKQSRTDNMVDRISKGKTTRSNPRDAGTTPTQKNEISMAIQESYRGGNGGNASGGRVICTDLHRTGELSTKDWIRDTKFTFKTLSITHVKGYLLWAEPTVKHMQKYPRYRKMWKHIAQHRANDIAWRLNEGKFDLLGRIYAGIGEPVCWALGNFVSDKQISKYNLTHWRRA